jgi:hypothetical protein
MENSWVVIYLLPIEVKYEKATRENPVFVENMGPSKTQYLP